MTPPSFFFSQGHQQKRKGNDKNIAQPKGTMTKLYSVLFDSIVSIFNNYN